MENLQEEENKKKVEEISVHWVFSLEKYDTLS